MLRTKIVLRKTNRGNVVHMVREHYLRDDIGCGVEECALCSQLAVYPNAVDPALLSREPRVTDRFPFPHYLLIDTTVALHQIDVLEHKAMHNVIVLRTVLDQVRDQSLPIYNRLRAIIADPERRFYVFSNEFHKDTFVERYPKESISARNERAILLAANWYARHVPEHVGGTTSVVFITNDALRREQATQDGLHACLLSDYVESLKEDAPELVDIVADAASAQDASDAMKVEYDEYLSQQQLQQGLQSERFYQGKLSISQSNLFEGSIYATVMGTEATTVRLIGRKNLNRAVHDDIVVVELLPREQWKSMEKQAVIDEEGEAEDASMAEPTNDANTSSNDPMEEVEDDASPISPMGKVVGIIRRNWRAYCGSIDQKSIRQQAGAQNVWFYPMERRVPRIRIRTRQAQNLAGQRIMVSIDAWQRTSMYPQGHFVRKLGSAGDRATEVEVLLLEHDVPFQPFTQQVLADLPKEGDQWIVQDHHLHGRKDYRDLDVCSIDPPGCTDIDDALHCRPLPNGNLEVGVHIADVTHFVKPHTAMDLEASQRGTTVYLVDKRIDMLPPLLGTNLCSLRSNVDRLAFSCVWELTPDAEIVNTHFSKSVIRSKSSFTYAEAQSRVDDKKMNDPLTLSIRTLNELAKKLRQRRADAGSLTLSSPEVRFQLEHDSQDPVDVEMKELKETNALVEEFMLLANISVAAKIYQHYPESAVLRRHPKPPSTSFDALRRALEPYGLHVDVENSKALADSLDRALLSGNAYFNKLVRILTTRCMMQAVYFCSGSLPEHEFWHYGLATHIYTHFTSPIRRYSDIMVHRLLAASIDTEEALLAADLLDRVKIMEVCDNLNYRHRMAQHASRSSVELYTNLFFRGKVVQEEGYITRVLKNGFSVLVPKYGIEGFVYASATGKSESQSLFTFDADRNRLVYQDVVLQIFSRVKIQITIDESSVAGLRQRLRMSLVEPIVPGLSVPLLPAGTNPQQSQSKNK